MKRILHLLVLILLAAAAPVSAMRPAEESPGPRAPALAAAQPAAQAVAKTGTQAVTQALAPFDCSYDAGLEALVNQSSAADWMGWIRKLSGAEPVTVGGEQVTLNNRHSYLLFNGRSKAYDYLLEQLLAWYPAGWIEEDEFTTYFNGAERTWKNLVLTIPGTQRSYESVIMSAHFDSTNGPASLAPVNSPAPGADDNASGSAALLEAARLLRDNPLPRTVRLIWFTGEEQGLRGSAAYVLDHPLDGVIGVINLDMYAYDGNSDGCFELHVSSISYPEAMAASERVGQCFTQALSEYDYGVALNYDYLDGNAVALSDHASFWSKGVGAIEVLENYMSDSEGACTASEFNPDYHSAEDTVDNINVETGFAITRAALLTAFKMASQPNTSPVYEYFFPMVNHQ